jgi:hypothetical protein
VFQLTNVNETTGTANAVLIGVVSTSQDTPQAGLSAQSTALRYIVIQKSSFLATWKQIF